MKTAGIVIFIAGLLMTMYAGVTFFTKEEVVDLGSIEITRDQRHDVHWQPYIGISTMIIGGGILIFGRKKSTTV